jgi:hypothetical protein
MTVSKETEDERGPTDDPNVEAESILLFISILALLLFLAAH